MTTAAKYGALDLLTPNGFNYQQLAAPQTSANTVVNVTATNRSASDTRVRVALTSVPLVPQLVTSTTAGIPFAISSTAASGNLITTHPTFIQSTSSSGNVFTTAAIPVTRTEQGTNLITCRETTSMYIGMPVIFTAGFGGLTANAVYYILTIPTSTTFTVSSTWGGPVVYLTSAYNTSGNVQFATSNLTLKQPITFTAPTVATTCTGVTSTGNYVTLASTANLFPGSTIVFSGTTFSSIISGTTYYVASINTQLPVPIAQISRSLTTVTVNTGFGTTLSSVSLKQFNTTANVWYITFAIPVQTAVAQTGVTYTVAGNSNGSYNGSFVAVASTTSSITLAYSNTDPGAFGSGTTTATSLVNHNYTSGQSVNVSNITTYGITDITSVVVTVVSATQYTFTHGTSGTVVQVQTPNSISTLIPQVTISSTNGGGVFSVGATASGSTTVSANNALFGGPAATTTYFINTIPSLTTFTVSAVSGSGTALTLTSVTGLLTMSPSTASLTLNQPVYIQGPTITFVSAAGTVLTTLGNTGNLTNNQPIVFYGYTYGGVTAGTVYYLTVLSPFTVSLSLTSGGTAITFSTFTYSMTATISIGAALNPLKTYYVNTIPSLTTFTLSATSGGSAVTLANASGIALLTSNLVSLGAGSTANLLPNQPVMFTGTPVGNVQTVPVTSVLGNTPFVISNTTSGAPGTCTTSSTTGLVLGQPVQFFGNSTNLIFGTGITANTVYYVFNITGTTFSIAISYANAIAGTGLAISTASGTMYCMPSYYIGAILSSTDVVLVSLPGNTIQNTVTSLTTTTAFNSLAQAQMSIIGLPLNTDFIEYDALIASNGILERTGILMPPNTYLYASATTTLVNLTAIGIQEAV